MSSGALTQLVASLENQAEKVKLALGAVALIGAAVSSMWLATSNAAPEKEETRIPAFFETLQKAGALPVTLSPALFSKSAASKAYQAAKEIPSILAQQSCYRHCDRASGHRSAYSTAIAMITPQVA